MPSYLVICDRLSSSETYWAKWTLCLKRDHVQNTPTPRAFRLVPLKQDIWLLILINHHLKTGKAWALTGLPWKNKKKNLLVSNTWFKIHLVPNCLETQTTEAWMYLGYQSCLIPCPEYTTEDNKDVRGHQKDTKLLTQSLREKHSSILCASCYA